jgi:hypothetical protein
MKVALHKHGPQDKGVHPLATAEHRERKVEELHGRDRGKRKDHSSILSHRNPAGQGSSRLVTWHARVLDAEKGPRELTELMPLDEPVQLGMICMLT